ncbi:MAG: hypothetical protein HC836_02400 [Richelia sp. RM2_1_2]|nr:hypothetical protein [Richelia sp. SM2_1_7]NJM18766.1 hypothetical protein [Richelia sp. SM1_7_0]NJN09628.1 hypothetical protein [Richelia sp. RM1_1_1]NJO27940.1 hypothetical protein [Richelia sp. SL_2_1]NJO57264.1 hypothetical protein [Richelia sp. RM2_1_2]
MQETTNSNNLLVLTLYIIGVSYIFNLMVESIDEQIKFAFDKASVDKQLKEQELDDKISITFKLKASNDIKGKDDVKDLLLILGNKSDNVAVYVDWDNCSLAENHKNVSRRVIRKSPDLSRDLAVPQSPSLIAPTQTLVQGITAEDVFERDQETGIYQTTKTLVDIVGLKASPNKAHRKLYKKFISRREEIKFSLQLVLRFSEVRVGLVPGQNIPPMSIITCPFIIRKLPWSYALPWNKKRAA